MEKIYTLDNPEILNDQSAGPKAANLGLLNSLHLPVPKGFCITGDFYRKHIKQNNLTSLVKSTVTASQENISELLRDLRKAITEAPLCESVKQEIEKQINLLKSS